MIMKNISYSIILLFALIAWAGCEKDYLSTQQVEITAQVSFSKDVVPILTQDCATPNCHVAGGTSPNLSADQAYDELNGLGYVDTTNAEESILYKRITATTDPMPPSEKLTPEEIGYILAWIKQGALNN